MRVLFCFFRLHLVQTQGSWAIKIVLFDWFALAPASDRALRRCAPPLAAKRRAVLSASSRRVWAGLVAEDDGIWDATGSIGRPS